MLRSAGFPSAMLGRLAARGGLDAREAVLGSRSCPRHAFALAARHSDKLWEIWEAAAANRACPRVMLNQLLASTDEAAQTAQERAAANRTLGSEMLMRCAVGHFMARRGAASNPALAPGWLSRLSTDGHPDVRETVACNPAVPDEALRRLSADEDRWVRREAIWNRSQRRDPSTDTAERSAEV